MTTTPVFLPGKSHGQRSLVGYTPWGSKESDDWLGCYYRVSTKVAFLPNLESGSLLVMIREISNSYNGAQSASEVTLIWAPLLWPWCKVSHLWPWEQDSTPTIGTKVKIGAEWSSFSGKGQHSCPNSLWEKSVPRSHSP